MGLNINNYQYLLINDNKCAKTCKMFIIGKTGLGHMEQYPSVI